MSRSVTPSPALTADPGLQGCSQSHAEYVICAARRVAGTAGRCLIWLDERMIRPGGHPDASSETVGVTASRNPGTAATVTR